LEAAFTHIKLTLSSRAREPHPLKVKRGAKYGWILTQLGRQSSGGGALGDVISKQE
jgi:hypothetical protein